MCISLDPIGSPGGVAQLRGWQKRAWYSGTCLIRSPLGPTPLLRHPCNRATPSGDKANCVSGHTPWHATDYVFTCASWCGRR